VFSPRSCFLPSQNRISGTFFAVLVRSVSKIEYEVIESALPKSSKVEHVEELLSSFTTKILDEVRRLHGISGARSPHFTPDEFHQQDDFRRLREEKNLIRVCFRLSLESDKIR
jgi:hypothetical protein